MKEMVQSFNLLTNGYFESITPSNWSLYKFHFLQNEIQKLPFYILTWNITAAMETAHTLVTQLRSELFWWRSRAGRSHGQQYWRKWPGSASGTKRCLVCRAWNQLLIPGTIFIRIQQMKSAMKIKISL